MNMSVDDSHNFYLTRRAKPIVAGFESYKNAHLI